MHVIVDQSFIQFGETAVYFASIEGYSAIVRLLVQAGADLELPLKVY